MFPYCRQQVSLARSAGFAGLKCVGHHPHDVRVLQWRHWVVVGGVLAARTEVADRAFVGGTARVASAFGEVERVRQVLDVLERQFIVVTMIRDVIDRGLSVAIGTETGVEPLADCSLVVAPYEIDGETAGSIGVLGPTRMNYSQALATVAVVGRRLGDRLTDG